jgi:SAM-dependent methyltransferase
MNYDVYARLYDLDFGENDDDMLMLQQFAARCGSPILELGCGTGRALVPLARQGYQITGVDISPAMLDIARHKIEVEGLANCVRLVEQDMRELDLGIRHNLAFSAINSFMHMLTLEDQLAALSSIRSHLNPGGLLVLDLFNPDLNRLLSCRGQLELVKVMTDPNTGHELMRFITDSADLGKQRIRATFIVDRVDNEGQVNRTRFAFTIRYLFRNELELLLRHAGFEVEAIYGSYDLDEYSGDSPKMIAVARRPAQEVPVTG